MYYPSCYKMWWYHAISEASWRHMVHRDDNMYTLWPSRLFIWWNYAIRAIFQWHHWIVSLFDIIILYIDLNRYMIRAHGMISSHGTAWWITWFIRLFIMYYHHVTKCDGIMPYRRHHDVIWFIEMITCIHFGHLVYSYDGTMPYARFLSDIIGWYHYLILLF